MIMGNGEGYDLFSRIFEVFSEMEMEINIIDNKIFTNYI